MGDIASVGVSDPDYNALNDAKLQLFRIKDQDLDKILWYYCRKLNMTDHLRDNIPLSVQNIINSYTNYLIPSILIYLENQLINVNDSYKTLRLFFFTPKSPINKQKMQNILFNTKNLNTINPKSLTADIYIYCDLIVKFFTDSAFVKDDGYGLIGRYIGLFWSKKQTLELLDKVHTKDVYKCYICEHECVMTRNNLWQITTDAYTNIWNHLSDKHGEYLDENTSDEELNKLLIEYVPEIRREMFWWLCYICANVAYYGESNCVEMEEICGVFADLVCPSFEWILERGVQQILTKMLGK